MEKKQLTLVVVSLLVVVLSVSVAYFTAQIIGEGKEVSVTSANLQVIFEDTGGAISSTDIEPGWTSTKTFTVKNSTKSEYKYNIVLKDLVNTFVTEGYLQYKITSTNSGYNMTEFKDVPKSSTATDTILAYNVSVPVETTQTYTVEFKYSNDENVDQSKDMGKKLSGTLFITEGSYKTITYADGTFGKQLLSDKKQINSDRPDDGLTSNKFMFPYSTDNTETLYTSTEDNTIVYYFAGNALDNWVKFGKNSSGADLYWRIIRTNADGGIRLLYHSTSPTAEDAYISSSTPFNSTSDSSKYVGYMYGDTDATLDEARTNTNNSTIKSVIDSWYENNLKTNYGKYLSETAVYCNDREVGEGTYSTTGTEFYYNAYTRLETNKTPTYDCTNTNDKFTVSTSTGNGKLDYPIALMTADELVFAGMVLNGPGTTYCYYNSSKKNSMKMKSYMWTMSPIFSRASFQTMASIMLESEIYVEMIIVGTDETGETTLTRPVISLKSCVKYSGGDGSADNPYTIDESYEC